jgi:Protein of unknown function (DUF4242)
MPRYVVQRTFPAGLNIPIATEGADLCRSVVECNTEEGVTWVHSYVSEDKRSTFCVYDAPTLKRSPRQPHAITSQSIRSLRCGLSTPTSTRESCRSHPCSQRAARRAGLLKSMYSTSTSSGEGGVMPR